MKALGFSIGAVVFCLTLFLGGLTSSNTLPLFAGFCLWTPAILLLGWSVRGLFIGKRLRWETVEPETNTSPHRVNSRLRGITTEKTT